MQSVAVTKQLNQQLLSHNLRCWLKSRVGSSHDEVTVVCWADSSQIREQEEHDRVTVYIIEEHSYEDRYWPHITSAKYPSNSVSRRGAGGGCRQRDELRDQC